MERPSKDITWDALQTMRGNTEFWRSLFPKMTSDAFVKQSKHYLANCSSHYKGVTYDDVVITTILPEALLRIQELEKVLGQLIGAAMAPPVSYCTDCNCGKAEGCG